METPRTPVSDSSTPRGGGSTCAMESAPQMQLPLHSTSAIWAWCEQAAVTGARTVELCF
jgi:hypothetical protein